MTRSELIGKNTRDQENPAVLVEVSAHEKKAVIDWALKNTSGTSEEIAQLSGFPLDIVIQWRKELGQ